MSKMKISNIEKIQLGMEGFGVSDIARKVGVSKGTVSKRLKALNVGITPNVALHHAGEIAEMKLDAIKQLQKINDYADELLDLLMRWNRVDKAALQILQSQVASKKVRIGNQEESFKEFKFKDSRELALRAMQEIRGQLGLQLKIYRALYDMAAAAEFQKEVLTAIWEVEPDVRDKIIYNLQKARVIRSTLKFH